DLARSLPKGTALVDFVTYRRYDFSNPKDPGRPLHVAAFVLRPSHGVVRAELGPARPLITHLDQWRRDLAAMKPSTAGGKLRTALWAPLEKHIGDADTVLLSPVDFLAGLPFNALPGKKPGSYLIEERALATVLSPAQLPALLGQKPAP